MGINQLDELGCHEHDRAYAKSKDDIRKADKKLEYFAWNRVLSKDAGAKQKFDASHEAEINDRVRRRLGNVPAKGV